MKKAIYIINSLQNGGAEQVVANQANYLAKRGVDVTVIFLRKWMQYELSPEVHRIWLTEQKTFSTLDYVTKLIPLVHRINRALDLATRDGEVVLLTSHLLYPDVITRLSRYSRRAMYVLHSHQSILPYAGTLPYRIFIRWLYGNRQIACVGTEIKREMREVYHLPQKTIQPMWNPLNFQEIDRKKEETLDFPGPYILYCARLTAVKRPDRLITAFYEGEFYKKYRLVILGIGELEEKLKEMAKDYGIESRVYFGGWQTNVYKWMKHAALLVLSSDVEGLPMTLVEALYCGCPVVAVKNYGSKQVLRGELKEYLCEPTAEDVAARMRMALVSYPGNLKKYTSECAVEKVVEKYMETYRRWNS